MPRIILLWTLFLSGPALAQQLPAADNALPAVTRPSSTADTAQAVHRLFVRHRRLGALLAGGAIAADLTLAGVATASQPDASSSSGGGFGLGGTTFRLGFGQHALVFGVLMAPIAGVGVQQLIAYRPERETQVLADHAAHGTLPARVRRQLRRYLRQ
ncbi:hypothetical protein [Hymenobacter sp. CRA2]|uniref:hypothetical protein n=1 Tax=Hymenobacter sp. CRA2 TaxID=1955620 RepID=UPI00098F0342|nr:hypothetical protein [Hymenobacter sp. CRA2]OON69814.1 hypothetical protein B0919_07770 [Hymenobacter sp. CRA2]